MGTIRFRFILVALVVSFFAIGMAAFLNYFKYKSTIGNIVKSRVLVIGQGIENSVQASLQLGMQFAELSQLPQLLARERLSDRLTAASTSRCERPDPSSTERTRRAPGPDR